VDCVRLAGCFDSTELIEGSTSAAIKLAINAKRTDLSIMRFNPFYPVKAIGLALMSMLRRVNWGIGRWKILPIIRNYFH
jgi:hypothetical protein